MIKPWNPTTQDGGNAYEGIYLNLENCSGCGTPSVYGEARKFRLCGFAPFIKQCSPVVRYKNSTLGGHSWGEYVYNGFCDLILATGDPIIRYTGGCSHDTNCDCAAEWDEEEEEWSGVECASGCETVVNGMMESWDCVLNHETGEYDCEWAPGPATCMVGERIISATRIEGDCNSDCSTDPYCEEYKDVPPLTGEECTTKRLNGTITPEEDAWCGCKYGLFRPFHKCSGDICGHTTLSNPDTFSDAVGRAANSQDCLWSHGYKYPLAIFANDPWYCWPCYEVWNNCTARPAGPGVGEFATRGWHRAQPDGVGFPSGCLNFHWGWRGVSEGPDPYATAAKYRIVIPYYATLPGTVLDVEWRVVRRKNKATLWLTSELMPIPGCEYDPAECYQVPCEEPTPTEPGWSGASTTDTWKKTVRLGGLDENGDFVANTAMDAPVDRYGSTKEDDDSWDGLSWEAKEGQTHEITGGQRAKYRFMVLGAESGSVSWKVQQDNDTFESESATLTDGATPEFYLAVDEFAAAPATSASIMDVSVTIDGDPVPHGVGETGRWMLQVKHRNSGWGWAELHEPSDPPKHYLVKQTTLERTQVSTGGACTECPTEPLNAHSIYQFEEKTIEGETERRVIEDSITQIAPDESEKSGRWGIDHFNIASSGNPSGRPEWHQPIGCVTDDTSAPGYQPDPYQLITETAEKTREVYEEQLVMLDIRTCAMLVLTEPDPEGEILGSEDKSATASDIEDDDTSIMQLKKIAGVPGGDDCLDVHRSFNGKLAATSDGEECEHTAVSIGEKIYDASDNTYWEVIGVPEEPCENLTEDHFRRMFYKSTPEQFDYSAHGDSTYFIEAISVREHVEEEEE